MSKFIILNILLLWMSLALIGCNANLVLVSETDDGAKSIVIPEIALSSLTVNSLSHTTLNLSVPFTGDTNGNASVVLYFCSIKVLAGCDPLSGHSVTLTKSNGEYQGLIDLALTTITPGDLLKYQIQATDVDGVASNAESDFLIIPYAGSPRLINQLGYLTMNQKTDASASENVNSSVVDSLGRLYVAGTTSGNLGELNAGGADVFVLRLTPSGNLDTTFNGDGIFQLGHVTLGDKASAGEWVHSVALDGSGRVYVSGTTTGNLGELNGGVYDAYVLRLTSLGVLDNTFGGDGIVQLGNVTVGAAASGSEFGYGLNIDGNGKIYLAGNTSGSFGETTAGSSDVFVVRLDTLGNLDTTFGGDGIVQLGNVTVGAGASGNQQVRSIATDSSENLYVAGHTTGNFGETSAGGNDAFVVKLTQSGSLDTTFSSDGIVHLGNATVGAAASGWQGVNAMALDPNGNVYLTGNTSGSFGETSGGSDDAYVVRINSVGNLDVTFSGDGILQLGNSTIGSGASSIEVVTSIKLDVSGRVYLSGRTTGDFGEPRAGYHDGFVVRLTSTGNLDSTFNGDGIVHFGSTTLGAGASWTDRIEAMSLDTSGNVYVVGYTEGNLGEEGAGYGDAFVVRLNASGSLDSQFSGDGIFQLGKITGGHGVSSNQSFRAIALDASGNVYLAGNADGKFGVDTSNRSDLFLARFTPSGNLDVTFGDDGIVRLDSTGRIIANKVLIEGSGRIYLAGTTLADFGEVSAGGEDIFVVRLTSSGSLDTTFSTDGIVQLGNVTVGTGASGDQLVSGLDLDSTGRVYVAGTTSGNFGEVTAAMDYDAYVVRLTSSGQLDSTFNGDGIVHLGTTTLGAAASGWQFVGGISIDGSDRIYIAGDTGGNFGESSAGSADVFVVRLNSSGNLDTTFSGDGIVQLGNATIGSAASGNDKVRAITLDGSGNVIVAGETTGGLGEANAGTQSEDIFLVKLITAGSLDTSFSSDGILQFGNVTRGASASGVDRISDINIGSNNDIYLAGSTWGNFSETNGGGSDALVLRVTSSGVLDNTFNGDGILQFGSVTAPNQSLGDQLFTGVTLDGAGNIFISGQASGSFGEWSTSSTDGFFVTLDPNGDPP